VTRDDGTFRAFPVPPGRVRAIVHHPSYIEGVSEVALLGPGGEVHVRVVMRGGGTLEGRVLDDRHVPVAGVRVEVAATRGSLERTTLTADDGTFAFAAVPGDIVISASRPDPLDDVSFRTNVSIQEGERKDVEIVLPAARDPMTVAIVDERGTPLDGAQVLVLSLAPDAPLRRTQFTDRDGRAVFKGALGLPVRVSVERRGRAPVIREIDAAPSELRIELNGGVSVTGVVTSRRGRDRVEGAEVTLYTTAGPRRGRSDRDGVYRFDDVPPGSARLCAAHAGYAKTERTVSIESAARPDRPSPLEPLDLEEGGTIEGEVVDARGDPVAGARVAEGTVPTSPTIGKLPPGVVVTNRQGEFKLDDIAGGDVILEAYAPDLSRGRVAGVHVTPGRATGRVRISLVAAPEGDP
jgi:protocatechuate 3,4-dioxygenase beta subunit